jgi:predicted DNA-binding transcriptional regulator AlpA
MDITMAAVAIMQKIEAGLIPCHFTARDVYNMRWRGLGTPSTVKAMLDGMARDGLLSCYTRDTGGRPSVVYAFSPITPKTTEPAPVENRGVPRPVFVNEKQLAQMLGMSVATVRSWRYPKFADDLPSGPPWVKIGRSVRYETCEVEKFIRGLRP